MTKNMNVIEISPKETEQKVIDTASAEIPENTNENTTLENQNVSKQPGNAISTPDNKNIPEHPGNVSPKPKKESTQPISQPAKTTKKSVATNKKTEKAAPAPPSQPVVIRKSVIKRDTIVKKVQVNNEK